MKLWGLRKNKVWRMVKNLEVWNSLKSSSFFLLLLDETLRFECTEEDTLKGRHLSPEENLEECSKPWAIESFGTLLDMDCLEFCCTYMLTSMAPDCRDRQAPASYRQTRNCKWTQADAARGRRADDVEPSTRLSLPTSFLASERTGALGGATSSHVKRRIMG